MVVPEVRKHVASVIRCSSCGGPRQADELTCGFCGSDFTLHERDLHTICPGCAARISDKARFCHHCGLPITPLAASDKETPYACPVCETQPRLKSRSLGGEGITVLECGRCGGLWLGNEVFRLLQERAQRNEVDWLTSASSGAFLEGQASWRRGERLYRRCVICGKQMNRRNFRRRSGVVIDFCPADGFWFDSGELERILRWIRSGGLSEAERRRRADEREKERSQKWKSPGPLDKTPLEEQSLFSSREAPPDFVSSLIRFLSG